MLTAILETPQLWLTLVTFIFLVALALYSWRHRSVPGALLFSVSSLFSALWMVGSFLEFVMPGVAAKFFWFKVQAAIQLPATTAVTCFALEYTWPGRWLTRRSLALLSLAPVLALLLVWTNDLHHFLWLDVIVEGATTVVRYNWSSWLLVFYSYCLALLSVIVFSWLFRRSPQHHIPAALMLAGIILARAVYLLDMLRVIRFGVPADVLTLGFAYLMFGIALFAFRIFNPIELARQSAVFQMRDGMLVLDLAGRVAGLNPASQAMLGVSERHALGRPVQELLLGQPAFPGDFLSAADSQAELYLGDSAAPRSYQLTLSALKDWRGLPVGRLLLLHDITEQKRVQAALIEQQHIRATHQERERLARELHDTWVQTTASLRMLAETAGMQLERGEQAPVRAALEQIADTTQQMHLDLRRYIFEIRSGLNREQSFFEELRDYLDRYRQTWGIAVDLQIAPELERGSLDPAADRVQLMGILQEALSNVRKHARAQRVWLRFKCEAGRLDLTVEDDGCGFDPVPLSLLVGNRFGLRSLSERARSLGGVFEIHSAPGQGTRVLVSIPLKANPQEPKIA